MTSLRCKDTALFQKFGMAAYNTLWQLVNLIQTTRTVNLNQIKQEMGKVVQLKNGKESKPDSHYKRIIRFFD